MNVGLLVVSIGNFGKTGFYNIQEIGFAKALIEVDKNINVTLYKLVSKKENKEEQYIDDTKRIKYVSLPSIKFGTNGIVNINYLNNNLDVLVIYPSVYQTISHVYNWAIKNRIIVYFYIGVLESHSNNKLVKFVLDYYYKKNISLYKKSKCFAKTPNVKKELIARGVSEVNLLPVGLDLDLMNRKYYSLNINLVKNKYGYNEHDKVILFIGRFTKEKNPILMLEIFKEALKKNCNYKLLMVGDGELSSAVNQKIRDFNISEYVNIIKKIQNNKINELYCMSECIVNLNTNEIFGMSILEALYYECKVIALCAPGPNYISNEIRCNFLACNTDEIIDKLDKDTYNLRYAHNTIETYFSWSKQAERFIDIIKKDYGMLYYD